jgi:hypothetical protein
MPYQLEREEMNEVGKEKWDTADRSFEEGEYLNKNAPYHLAVFSSGCEVKHETRVT